MVSKLNSIFIPIIKKNKKIISKVISKRSKNKIFSDYQFPTNLRYTMEKGIRVNSLDTNDLLHQKKNYENNMLQSQSINQNNGIVRFHPSTSQGQNHEASLSNPKKTKSTVYKFKNIPPVIFGKNENDSSMIPETRSDKENLANLRENSEKNSGMEKQISYCPNCEVEILPNSIRRYRLGYIEFTYPVTHIWYLSSYIPLLLNLPRSFVEGIAECHESFSSGFPPLSAWSYNGLEPISWTFQNQLIQFPIHFNSRYFLKYRDTTHNVINDIPALRSSLQRSEEMPLTFSSFSQSNKLELSKKFAHEGMFTKLINHISIPIYCVAASKLSQRTKGNNITRMENKSLPIGISPVMEIFDNSVSFLGFPRPRNLEKSTRHASHTLKENFNSNLWYLQEVEFKKNKNKHYQSEKKKHFLFYYFYYFQLEQFFSFSHSNFQYIPRNFTLFLKNFFYRNKLKLFFTNYHNINSFRNTSKDHLYNPRNRSWKKKKRKNFQFDQNLFDIGARFANVNHVGRVKKVSEPQTKLIKTRKKNKTLRKQRFVGNTMGTHSHWAFSFFHKIRSGNKIGHFISLNFSRVCPVRSLAVKPRGRAPKKHLLWCFQANDGNANLINFSTRPVSNLEFYQNSRFGFEKKRLPPYFQAHKKNLFQLANYLNFSREENL